MDINKEYNYLLYGDSITKGIIYDEVKNKYVTLEDNFANIMKKKLKGVIYNAGKFGNTIIRGERKLDHELVKSSPDIALIEFGGNDCDYKWDEISKDPFGIHEPNTDIETFKATLTSIIDKFKGINVIPVLMTLPPLDADRYFKWITNKDSINTANVLSWLGSISKLYWWQERYNSAIIDIVDKTKTIYIDVRGAFLKQEDYRQFICIDGIHPNCEGQKLIADKIIDFVNLKYNYLLI